MLKKQLLQKLVSLSIFTIVTAIFALTVATLTHAQDYDFIFTTNYSIEYTPGQNFVAVTEKLNIKVNTTKYILPFNSTQDFTINDQKLILDPAERQFKKDSLKVTSEYDNEITNYTITDSEKGFDLSIPRGYQVDFNNSYTVIIKYNTHDLIDIKGSITNLYIPGLAKDSQFVQTDEKTKTTTQILFNAALIVPATSPQASYFQPGNFVTKTNDEKRTYSISGESLLGKTGWIQLGTKQFTYFKLTQKAAKTDFVTPIELSKFSDLISTNIYKITIPREFDETNQTVLYKSISPTPKKIERDKEGNLIATFEVPANQDTTITIEGYTEMSKNENRTIPIVNYTDYLEKVTNNIDFKKYLQSDQYWQITDPLIVSTAETISKDKTTVNQIINDTYQYVVDKFTYSKEKVNGDNERLGAVAALEGSQTVCMEYADTLITLLRAKGIAARPAFGYGNDPTVDNTTNEFSVKSTVQSSTIGHQWVQVWLPDYGWMSLDPTWGETGRTYIGGDLDHVLWYTVSRLSDPIYDSLLYSADNGTSVMDNFELELRPVTEKEFPGEANLQSLDIIVNGNIVESTGDKTTKDLDFAIKTSSLGRTLIVSAPVCMVLVFLLFVMILLSNVIKRARKKPEYIVVNQDLSSDRLPSVGSVDQPTSQFKS